MKKLSTQRYSVRQQCIYRCLSLILAALWLALPQPAHAGQTKRLRIGFIVPLSGSLAEFGEAIRNGVTLAGEHNPKVNQVFEARYEDSRYDSKTSVSNLQKLRIVDKVHAVYVFGGPMSDTLAPIAEQLQIPMFSTEYDVRYTRGRKYVFRFANNAEDYAGALLEALRSKGIRRLALVKVENQYHNTLSQALMKSLEEDEDAKMLHNFQPGERDFRAALTRLRQSRFDALGIYLTPGMQHGFLSQLKQLGIRTQLFGTDSFESPQENKGVEDVVEGALYANSAVSDQFAAQYFTRFGNDSQIVHAALAYEFVLLAAHLFEGQKKDLTPESFVQRFALAKGRQSVCGTYFYRNSEQSGQYFSFPIAVREIRKGRAQILAVTPAP